MSPRYRDAENNQDEKEQWISEAMNRMQDLIHKSGIFETASLIKKHFGGSGKDDLPYSSMENEINLTDKNTDDQSVVTIYQNALKDLVGKRDSTSSEDDSPVDTSGELDNSKIAGQQLIDKFILDQREKVRNTPKRTPRKLTRDSDTEPVASTSKDTEYVKRGEDRELMPEKKSEKMIKDAEEAKIRILQAPGKAQILSPNFDQTDKADRLYSSIIDEEYMVLTNHVDKLTQERIQNGEYVDLSKLIPKDKVLVEDDNRMQLVIRNG